MCNKCSLCKIPPNYHKQLNESIYLSFGGHYFKISLVFPLAHIVSLQVIVVSVVHQLEITC